jgi:hypothetical protein
MVLSQWIHVLSHSLEFTWTWLGWTAILDMQRNSVVRFGMNDV